MDLFRVILNVEYANNNKKSWHQTSTHSAVYNYSLTLISYDPLCALRVNFGLMLPLLPGRLKRFSCRTTVVGSNSNIG